MTAPNAASPRLGPLRNWTPASAARYRARVKPGESVLVVGCGGDGMNVVQGAHLCGASQIIAADVVAAKLDWARESARPMESTHRAKG